MPVAPPPLVSVGIPVFNGEAYLEDAIRSVLGQSLDDLELIISDNASTDRTSEICRDFASSDPRVVYRRNPRNLGAAPNYNAVYEMARGRYFKWLAHDDRLLPGYLAATSRALEEQPDAVLCNTVVRYIDARGEYLGLYDSGLGAAADSRPSARFASLVLRSHSCVDFFGLIRRTALERSLLHAPFHGADRALLAQLALRGRMVQLREPLVEMREHDRRYTRAQGSARERQSWHDTSRAGRPSLPTWRLYAEYVRMVSREPLPAAERARCFAVLAAWWAVNWNAARALVDLASLVVPDAVGRAERLKTRLFGAAPGHLSRNQPR